MYGTAFEAGSLQRLWLRGFPPAYLAKSSADGMI